MMNDMHNQLHDLYFNTALNYIVAYNGDDLDSYSRWEQTLLDLRNIMVEFGFKPKQIQSIFESAKEFYEEHKE